jgi:intracellular sulfur oxidation DsrE/DsrF family protein
MERAFMKKVVFHVDEMEKWPMALSNIRNMLRGYQESATACQIELLANGAAVRAYADNAGENQSAMQALADAGVLFAACNNALRAAFIEPQALFAFVTVVPVGVIELAERQLAGYAYIKP